MYQVLFLGCGDVMKTLEVSTTKHLKNVHIHLNDKNSLVLARNILILKVIFDEDFDPDNKDDLTFLWDLWYNLDWPDSTERRFTQAINGLLGGILPKNVSVPYGSHLKVLMEVWRGWLSLSLKTHCKSFIENVHKER